jgi:ABC-type multidrug transport system fused ATPase/permease subunit
MRRDTRVSRVTELISAIKLVKSNAWEAGFIRRVEEARQLELNGLFKYYLYMLMSGVVWEGAVPLTAAVTFITYAYLGNTLAPAVAFTALSLFDVMVEPCQDMAWIFSQFIVALTSFNRVGAFLESQDLDTNAVRRNSPVALASVGAKKAGDAEAGQAITIKGGCFGWGSPPQPDLELKQVKRVVAALDKAFEAGAITDKRHENSKAFLLRGVVPGCESTSFELNDINMTVETGSCVGIVGQVGCGKTSLIHAILGEMEVVAGTVEARGNVAYVAQTAFIVNATIRANILFGQPMDQLRYEQCLDICCLCPDLEMLPGGDSCEIGEQGINLSGGQKQRLSLARAVYAALMGSADIILLDDVLSAVDAHVGARIMEECINKVLRQTGKTVVLVTHAIQYLPQCDTIVVMDAGKVVETGTFDELMSLRGKLTALVETYQTESGPAAACSRDGGKLEKPGDQENGESGLEKKDKEQKSNAGALVDEETRDEGRVKMSVYIAYIRAAGVFMFILVISLFAAFPVTGMMTSYWLVYWSEDRLGWSQYEYVAVYTMIAMASIVTIAIRNIFRTMLAVKAAKTMHGQLLVAVAKAPLSFFHTTPAGRILNRFSSDQTTVDETFFNSFCGIFRNCFKLLATLVVIITANPIFALFLGPISWIYVKINTFYITSNREVKRLESVSRSPVYSHFSETISGVVTVRAYR